MIVPDPTNPQSFNRYSYVENRPLNFFDPSGHNSICNYDQTICSDGAYDDGGHEPSYGLSTTIANIRSWEILGDLHDPVRTEPLKTPIIMDNQIMGSFYAMPVGAEQSIVSEDSGWYKFGRFLAGVGIAIDVGEVILSPIPGAGIGPGYTDALVTYFSGAFTGDNYIGNNAPPGLPNDLVSINQDLVMNGVEAIVPQLSATAFGVTSLMADLATAPIPADSLIYLPVGAVATQIIDATTSAATAIYDSGRYNGSIPNYFSIGISIEDGGLVIVYWPQN
ncbi:MAG: hypothetical protein H6658_09470 [Ardenticatenaceae bacterium]|nr:hypothetical protein [Ardenticatenaceae bacterium]